MELNNIDIHGLLPQQEPFVMVGRLTHYDQRRTSTATAITPDNILVDNDRLSPAGLIENMAQSCAARIGYYNKYVIGRDICVGFIGAVRNLDILRLPLVGEEIHTDIDILEEVFGMTLVRATVTAGGEVIAGGEMKIAVESNTAAS